MKEEIGKRITELRKSMNMTKKDFAKIIGISSQYLGRVEAGIHGLSLDSMMALCQATNVSADYILFGTVHMTDQRLKDVFYGIDKTQIDDAFKVLEYIALFIKDRTT